jgi:hypothetical protein
MNAERVKTAGITKARYTKGLNVETIKKGEAIRIGENPISSVIFS